MRVFKKSSINEDHLTEFMIYIAAMIHWARQIKEVLSEQESVELAENATPLEEIEFWKNRCEDLSGQSRFSRFFTF